MLYLNDAEDTKRYQAYPQEGTKKIIDQMPELIADGRVPMSVYGLALRRLEVLNPKVSKEVRDAWWHNSFNTGDAIVYGTQGNIKIVLDAAPLRKLNPKSNLCKGALVLPEGTYATLQGESFTEDEIDKYDRKLHQQGQASENPIWIALFRGYKATLKEYETAAFAYAKEFRWDQAMSIIIKSSYRCINGMRTWEVTGVCSDLINGTGTIIGQGVKYGRLVGVAPVAQKISKPLEQRV